MLWLDLANPRLAADLGGSRKVPYGAQALPHNGSATRSLTFRYIVRSATVELLETPACPARPLLWKTAALWATRRANL